MPYRCVKVKDKWELQKEDGSKVMGTHDSYSSCTKQMRAIYSQENDPKNVASIDVTGFIDSYVKENVNYNIANVGGRKLVVNITTKGGSYLEAIEIFNILRGCKKKVHTHINSFAFSAGAVIALAGDHISMNENALLMFHSPMYISNETKNVEQLEKTIQQLKTSEDSLVSMIVARCGMKEEDARNFLKEEKYLTAKEALSMKIIDEIVPLHTKVRVDDIKNVVPDLILNHVQTLNLELDKMALSDICSTFSIQIVNNSEEESLVNYIKSLQTKITTLEKPKYQLPESIVNMVKKTREHDINCLVSEGYITPVVAAELKTKFATIRNESVDEKGDIIDGFDDMVCMLRKNEKIISFQGKAGVQALPKDADGKAINPLLADMESRK